MKKKFFLLLFAAAAVLNACVVDNGGNRVRTASSLHNYACIMVEQSVGVSISMINQMLHEGRDINAEGFTAKGEDGILFVRTAQDCWDVYGSYGAFDFQLSLQRLPADDGFDNWVCRDVECSHDEGSDGYMLMHNEDDITFDWVTHSSSLSVSSVLEQTGTYYVEFHPESINATHKGPGDWCRLSYKDGEPSSVTSLGTHRDFYYE